MKYRQNVLPFMNHSCHFCNRPFDIALSHIDHESKCGYECLLYNPHSLEQNPPTLPTMVRVMHYMASQLNALQESHRNPTENKPTIQKNTPYTKSNMNPLQILQNNTHPSETITSFFESHVFSYIPNHIDTVFEKGLCEGMKLILSDAMSNYENVLPIQSHIVKLSKYYGYVFSKEEKLYEWKKIPVAFLNQLFKSLETEIIDYFDNVWKHDNIHILNDLDKFYHYVGRVTGENDYCDSVRNKQLRNIIDKKGHVQSQQPTNDIEE